MISVQTICDWLEDIAPCHLAEEWDNVGLLIGDASRPVERVMTCLTLTEDCLDEAIREQAEVVIAHHPLPFRPVSRITAGNRTGRLILRAIQAGIAVCSPHTAFDSAAEGINAQLADGLGLTNVEPCRPADESSSDSKLLVGTGRMGLCDPVCNGAEFVEQVKRFLGLSHVATAGPLEREIHRAAVACGAAGGFLSDAVEHRCDAFLTGESNFHTCLEARGEGILLILTGHFASERFALDRLAKRLKTAFPDLITWASRVESNPVTIV